MTSFHVMVAICGVITIALHELGHYFAMREMGVRVRAVSLFGLPIPYLMRARLSWVRGETTWYIFPIPLGGFVLPHEGEIERLGFWERIYVYSGGPIANLLVACAAAVLYNSSILAVAGYTDQLAGMAILSLGFLIVLWGMRGSIGVALPLVGIFAVVLLLEMYFNVSFRSRNEAPSTLEQVEVPAMMVKPLIALYVFGSTNLFIGIINCLPLGIADGGRITRSLIEHFTSTKIAEIFENATLPILVLLALYMFGFDMYRLFKLFL